MCMLVMIVFLFCFDIPAIDDLGVQDAYWRGAMERIGHDFPGL